MIIHEVVQGSPEWHALRASHDTASEASAMMGATKKTTRSELLRMKATSSVKEFSDWVQKNLLEKGHKIEAKARPLAEELIDEELFPCTASSAEYTRLLASFDGVSILGNTVWECKSWNEAKAADVLDGKVPDEDHWQVVQQLVVSRADQCLYTVTDGTPERTVSVMVMLDPMDEKRLMAGWKQFNEDLANYTPSEDAAPVVAEAVEALPAVFVQVTGSVAVQNNFSTFEKALRHFLEEKLITDPSTDQDFADLKEQIKAMKKAEDALEAAEAHALAQVESVSSMKAAKDMLHELVRSNRLASEKLVKTKEAQIKRDIQEGGVRGFQEHVAKVIANLGLDRSQLPVMHIAPDFAGVMKSKRTLSSLQNAVDTELARVKIAVSEWGDNVRSCLEALNEASAGYEHLFRDLPELLAKDKEVAVLLAKQRVTDFQQAEQARLEAERERIRQEEQARLEAERERIRQEEQAKLQAAHEAASRQADLVQESAPIEPPPAPQVHPEPQPEQPEPCVEWEPEPERYSQAPAMDVLDLITISLAEYRQLLEDQATLHALQAGGVDNWSGYDDAMALLETEAEPA